MINRLITIGFDIDQMKKSNMEHSNGTKIVRDHKFSSVDQDSGLNRSVFQIKRFEFFAELLSTFESRVQSDEFSYNLSIQKCKNIKLEAH